ncbi:MAG TPA: penicillin-binding protein 2 [Verrucomicrobiae bacterium]|nr:penicillin-binding protein 2 [Verrucomicrobiae bacterium]
MKSRAQLVYRALVLLALVLLAFAGLGFRLVDLQVWRHDELSARAEANTQRRFWQTARRGDILDANGNLLATSVPAETVCADPFLINGQQSLVARTIAPLLQMDENEVFQRLQPRLYKNSKGEVCTNRYVVLQRKVPEDAWLKIRAAMTNLSVAVDESRMTKAERKEFRNFVFCLKQYSVFAEPDELRVYPNGALAAHVLGFVGTRQTNNTSELFGYDGIERFFDSKLSGASGWRVTGVDSHKHELVQLRDQDVGARDGLSVQLTIDIAIQHIVEEALANAYREHSPQGISAIVLRPKTGEILAMSSLPNFDPNNLQTITTNNEANVCISRLYEPGSTFKTIVISGALNEHIVSLNDTVFCENGAFHYGGIVLHDAEHDHFGNLTVQQVLQKSSNIGASKIGIKMGPEKLYDYMTDFGLGEFTGIPLPGEVSAHQFVRPPRDANGKPIWGKYSIAQIPMGQGVAVTRLQIAMAVAAIANGGVLMRPMLVKSLRDSDGNVVEKYEPQAVRRVITPETAHEMVEALKTVVTPDGTAPKAALTNYTVAGKTGTAQKVVNGTYANDKFVVTFIGFFPADNPELLIAVVMDAPKEGGHAFGGALCGPVFHEIAERCASYLNIPPDNLPKQETMQVAGNAQ